MRLTGIRLLSIIWAVLVIVGFFLSSLFLSLSLYYWAVPGVVALAIGIMVASRIWRYAKGASNVESGWSRRILMTLGLFFTGAMFFVLLVSTAMADISLLYNSQYLANAIVATEAANVGTGFMMNIFAFILPIFFGFGIGEAYLLYRLRHHYTISGW